MLKLEMSESRTKDLRQLETKLNITFLNKDLLKEALTHRSYLNESPQWPYSHNERLEFLGDAVLELAVSVLLFKGFPRAPEGQMTVLRAALVNFQKLAEVAHDLDLHKFIFMSKGEAKDTGRAHEVILANALESLIGAIYLDQGFKTVHSFIQKFIFSALPEVLKTKSYKDPKSELQEIIQEELKLTPNYQVLGENGPAHARIFRIGVYFGNKLVAEGQGNSKQDAETEAARQALKQHQRKTS